MAHLKAQATRQVSQERFEWKLAITRRLYEKVMGEDVINLSIHRLGDEVSQS